MKNDPATGVPSAAQLGDDEIFTTSGNLGIGVTPTAKLDVDANGGVIKLRNLAVSPDYGGLNTLAHTTNNGNVYTTPFNLRVVSPPVAPGSSTVITDSLKFASGLVTVISTNSCGSTMIASFTYDISTSYGTGCLGYTSSIAKDIPGQAVLIPIAAGAPTAGYTITFPGTAPCAADGGDATQFDFKFNISSIVSKAAYFEITNNGNIPKTYTLSIVRL